MSLILNIDTATSLASVSLAYEGKVLLQQVNGQAMDHAAWIHTAISDMLRVHDVSYTMQDIKAVAVVAGPGSYTGLRVGMATAKGLCYVLKVPLISLNTLDVMAYAVNKNFTAPVLLCPMLDARRMEVFTALYDGNLNELLAPSAMILDENSFSAWLSTHKIIFFGNGSNKWKNVVRNSNADFTDNNYTPDEVAVLANKAFTQQAFSALAYAEPVYLKDFYSNVKNKAKAN